MKKNLAFLLFLFLPYFSFAQIVIEERVEILPEGVNTILPFGSISGDSRNPTYLGYGGDVTLRTIHSSNPNLELWEESLGRLTITGTTSIGTFPQWHKFIFYLLDPSTGTKYYPEPGDLIVWDWGSATIDFYPSHQPGDPYPPNPEDWWEIEVSADYSLAAMPPEEILNYFGNPFQPTEPMEIAVDGNLYAVITYVSYDNFTQQDELWIDVPGVQLIQDNIGNFEYETFDLGHMTAGDSVRFFLRTQNSIVSGMNLYPKQIREEIFMPDGDILLWRLEFEDWTDLQFDDVEVEIYITPDSLGSYPGPLEVTIEPAEIAPGDTADVVIKRRYLDGTLEDYPLEQLFETGMIEGCEAGMILVDTALAQYFEEVMQPIKFVADSNLTETDTVGIRVGLVEEIIGTRPININNENDVKMKREVVMKRKGRNINPPMENPVTFCFPGFFNSATLDDANVVVKDESIEILLGDTKYFQAKYPDPNSNKLIIEEVKPGPDGKPKLNGGLPIDVWGDNPVEVVECDTCGKKMGVYWEKKYPTESTEKIKIGKRTYRIVKMDALSDGLIRLVGRYLSPDSTYIVKLKAKKDSDSTEIKVRVIQPGKLGDSGNSSRDVSNKPISIDSICIANGGSFGIPPQIIKGHIAKEAVGFWPSYAYEPYTTEFNYRDANNGYKILDKWLNHPFLVDSTSMGSGASVPNHFNVKYYNYISTPTKVWEIVKRYSTLVENSPPGHVTKYCKRASNDSLDFSRYGYSTVQSIYNNILSYFQGKKSRADSSDFNNARDSMITYLRDYWRGGLNNHWAQTRLASSYGHLQLLLKTAIEEGYPDSSTKPPEDLNINSIHWPLAMKRLSRFLNEKGLEGAASKESKWPYGYEATFQRMLIGWNSRIYYSNEVLTNAKSYLPKK